MTPKKRKLWRGTQCYIVLWKHEGEWKQLSIPFGNRAVARAWINNYCAGPRTMHRIIKARMMEIV